MHHSVSLTTNFVKNFFPNNNLTQSSSTSSVAAVEEPTQLSAQTTEPINHHHQEESTTNMTQSTAATTTESITTQVSSPINRSVEESSVVPAVIDEPKKAVVEKKTVPLEEFNLAKFKYEQLKNQQNRLLEHLQDARVEHLEEEISKLDKLIPHHRTIQSYGCPTQKSDLINCFKSNNTAPYGTLNCSHLVKEFTKCAQQKRREFLGNPDL